MNTQQIVTKLKQYPLAVVGVLVIIVMLVLGYLRSDRLPNLSTEYDALQDEAEVIDANNSNAVDLGANLEQLEGIVADIDKRLIDTDAITANYRYFLGMGERSGIKYASDPPAAVYVVDPSLKQYGKAQFNNVSIRGEFENVLNYLYQVRTGEYILRVDSITLTPKGSGGSQEVVATFSLSGLAKKKEEPKKK